MTGEEETETNAKPKAKGEKRKTDVDSLTFRDTSTEHVVWKSKLF